MTVIRLNDSRLVVFSAIGLDEDEMAALEEYGRPACGYSRGHAVSTGDRAQRAVALLPL